MYYNLLFGEVMNFLDRLQYLWYHEYHDIHYIYCSAEQILPILSQYLNPVLSSVKNEVSYPSCNHSAILNWILYKIE